MTDKPVEMDADAIQRKVRDYYAAALAEKSAAPSRGCCCSESSDPCCGENTTLYEDAAVNALPEEVTAVSFGCGDPVTLASLKPGQTVLDLGSGGGIDCFLAAMKVGPTGQVIGVDMTPQMIDRARANKAKLKVENVEFRLGEIEHLPVADRSVDVVISNCVINLSPEKQQVFNETFRVLKPGGKLAVSDIVTDGQLPQELKNDLSAWAGCVSGALDAKDYISMIKKAGFENVTLTPVYLGEEMIKEAEQKLDPDLLKGYSREKISRAIFSAKITAVKP
jgi:ubiquinone/menaquinone biosynthesis C-methylase UbiE